MTLLALICELNTIQFESGYFITCVYTCGVYVCKYVLARVQRSAEDTRGPTLSFLTLLP